MALAGNVCENSLPVSVSFVTSTVGSLGSFPDPPPPGSRAPASSSPGPPRTTRILRTYGETNHWSRAVVNPPKPSTTRLTVSFASGSMSGEASSRRSGVPQTVAPREARERSLTLRTVSARWAW